MLPANGLLRPFTPIASDPEVAPSPAPTAPLRRVLGARFRRLPNFRPPKNFRPSKLLHPISSWAVQVYNCFMSADPDRRRAAATDIRIRTTIALGLELGLPWTIPSNARAVH